MVRALRNAMNDYTAGDKGNFANSDIRNDPFFHHAIISPELVRYSYEDKVLIEMVRELTKELRENESID